MTFKNSTPPTPPRRIVVLGTGGTIAGSSSRSGENLGYTAGTVPVSELLAGVETPAGFALQAEQVAQLDSKDMDFATWAVLHQRCESWLAQDDVAAVVVTHGTDTVEETSFFLHATLRSRKPVVFTCAMRPATSANPDGPQNLRDAVSVAATADATGVVVVCAGEVHGAKDIFKQHPYRMNAFSSGDAGVLGYVEEGRVRLVRQWPAGRNMHQDTFVAPEPGRWPRVEIVMSHAGARGDMIDALIRERLETAPAATQGLILAATGNGTLHRLIEEAGLRAESAGIEVRVATRCAEGQIVPEAAASLPMSVGLSPVKTRIELILELCARQVACTKK